MPRHPRMVGLRHIVHDEVDDRFMLGGNFLDGDWRLLKQHTI